MLGVAGCIIAEPSTSSPPHAAASLSGTLLTTLVKNIASLAAAAASLGAIEMLYWLSVDGHSEQPGHLHDKS